MHLNKSSMYHSHSKHIDVKYHTLRDIVEELQKVIQLKIIHIYKNVSNILAKVVSKQKLGRYSSNVG